MVGEEAVVVAMGAEIECKQAGLLLLNDGGRSTCSRLTWGANAGSGPWEREVRRARARGSTKHTSAIVKPIGSCMESAPAPLPSPSAANPAEMNDSGRPGYPGYPLEHLGGYVCCKWISLDRSRIGIFGRYERVVPENITRVTGGDVGGFAVHCPLTG
eukprot:scaffold265997_cov35-Tisochrysis_lutea.AAC.1